MKGIKPIWYAVGAGCVLVVLGIAVALSVAGNRNGAAHDAVPLNVAPALENREEAAERRRHLELTQRSLERLKEFQKETEEQKKAEDKPSASPTTAAAPATAPAAPAAAATAPAEPKPQARELDKLDNIGSDITKELGK
jgi:hypothetical protein